MVDQEPVQGQCWGRHEANKTPFASVGVRCQRVEQISVLFVSAHGGFRNAPSPRGGMFLEATANDMNMPLANRFLGILC